MSLVHDFAVLFQGRLDAYGTDDGGCDRSLTKNWASYEERVAAHLEGLNPMGVYPVRADNTCWWLCIDWDTTDAWDHAVAAAIAARTLGLTPWVERSRSKGFHLWVFFEEPIHSATARRAGLAICQVADASHKEVNPKQDVLVEGMLGNYVRLPYPGPPKGGLRSGQYVEHDENGPARGYMVGLAPFVERALASRASAREIAEVAGLYIEPPKPVAPRPDASTLTGGAVQRLSGLAWTVWTNGPLEGADRSDTLFKLVCLLREGGKHTASEAYSLLQDADARWGKWGGGGRHLETLFNRAWGA